MNTCPVCGYDKMTHPPSDYYICPCCGTEFENDDFETSHSELRQRWLQNGARWFSRATPRPAGWNPYSQLANLRVAPQPKTTAATGGSLLGIVDIAERVVIVQNEPRTEVRGRWQIIDLVGSVQIAHA